MHHAHARCVALICAAVILLANALWCFPPVAARAATAPTLDELGRLSGAILSVELQGDLAVVGDQQGILLLDVSHSASPIQISRLQLGGQINDLFVRNNLVYAANEAGLLQIVDITNPFAPRLRGQLIVPVSGQAVDIVGDRAAIAAHNGGLLIADIHDPDAPFILGQTGSVLGSTLDVRYIANRVYAVSLSGLFIFDVGDPTHPAQLGYYDAIANNQANGQAVDIAGSYAYLAVGATGLLILDVSAPAAPRQIGSVDTPGYTVGVQVVGGRAYLADREGGLQVADVQNSAQPQLVGTLDTAGYATRLAVVDQRVYLADWSGGLVIADVSQAQPARQGLYGVGGSSTKMVVVGDRLYISSYEGLVIADISTPNRPRVLGTLELPGYAYTLVASGTTVFLFHDLRKQNYNLNDSQITAVDVSNPSAPRILGAVTFTSAGVGDLVLVGTTLYATAGNQGLQLIDVANPRALVKLGAASAVAALYLGLMAIDGNLMYVNAYATPDYTTVVLDVSVPAAPKLVATLNLPNSQVRKARGPTLYAVETTQISQPFPNRNPPQYRSALKIVDASTFQALRVTSVYTPTQGRIQDVELRDNLAYVLTTAGLDLVDVGDPANPTLLASPALSAVPSTLLLTGDLLFGTGYVGGVQLYATSKRYVPSSRALSDDTRLTSADGAINLLFDRGDPNAPSINLAQMDRLTPSQSPDQTRAVERSFLVEARDAAGSSIGQSTASYTLEVTIAPTMLLAVSRLGVAYWNGTIWVDLPTCDTCGTQPGKLVVRTDHFGELAVVRDAQPVDPPTSTTQHQIFLPAILGAQSW